MSNQLAKQLNQFFSAPKPKRVDWYGRATRLAKKMGVTVEIERDTSGAAYWICDARLEGQQYCCDWQEVYEKLQFIKQAA